MEHERLLDWLCETRALEEGAAKVMRDHGPRLGNYSALSAWMADNQRDSEKQAIRLRACIDALDSAAGQKRASCRGRLALGEVCHSLSRVLREEEVSRGVLALYALKHLEIGSYRFMAGAAEFCQEPDIATVCRHSLEEELTMAARLELELAGMQEEGVVSASAMASDLRSTYT